MRTINSIRFGWVRCALLALFLCLGARARADIQFDVFLGYDGVLREASWFPIVCEIKNSDSGFTGVIEVTPDAFGKGQSQQMVVELPTGTTKRIVIPAFSSGRYSSMWTVRLLDNRGKVRAEQAAIRPRQPIGWEVKLLGSLSRTAGGSPQFRPIARDQSEFKPVTARFQTPIFPDNSLVLEGMNALYLSSEVAPNLRESQVQAILGWLNAGGHLIVGIEQVSDITALPWLRSTLPIEPTDARTISKHPELGEWLRGGGWESGGLSSAWSKPGSLSKSADSPFSDLPMDETFEAAELPIVTGKLRDGRAVVSAGGIPLIITANRGLGRVTVLMFSPEREPMKSWKQLPTFWSRLGEVPGVLYASTDLNQRYGQSADGIFGAMLDSRQVHKLPVGWLLLLLLVYLVIIGPLDQWWLKRIGKPMLTWITFPCYVALFSLLIYFIGYKLRAGEAEYNELHVVDVLRNGERTELRGRTYASIYSPANNTYQLESSQRVATFRSEFLGSGGGQGTEKALISHSGDNFKAEVFVPVWVSQLYVSDWWHSASPPLTVNLTRTANGWEVTTENHTSKPVSTARLVVDDYVYTLNAIPAGEKKTITVTTSSGMSLQTFVRQNSQTFHMAVSSRQRAFGESSRGQLDDLPNASIAASFISQMDDTPNNSQNFVVPPGLDLSSAVAQGNAVLLAWVPDHSPVKPMNQFKPKRNFAHTLWRIPISVTPR